MMSHADYLIRYGRSTSGLDADSVRDVVMSTFLDAWKGLSAIEDPQAIRRWLVTILKRKLLKVHKLSSREIVDGLVPEKASRAASAESFEEKYGNSQISQEILRLVALIAKTLPENERKLYDLRFRQGVGIRQLESELGVPAQTVYSRTRRMVTRLAKAVEAEVLVRDLGKGWNCKGLKTILEEARHVVSDSEVMPADLCKKVTSFLDNHATRCAECAEYDKVRDLFRAHWKPALVVALTLGGFWQLRDADPDVDVELVSAEHDIAARPRDVRSAGRRVLSRSIAAVPAVAGLALLLVIPSKAGIESLLGGVPSPQPSATAAPALVTPTTPGQRPGAEPWHGEQGEVPPEVPSSGALPGDVPAALIPATPPPPGALVLTPPVIDLPLYATTATMGITAGSDMSWTAIATDPAIAMASAGGALATGRTVPVKITVTPNAAASPGAGIVVTSSAGQKVTVPVRWQVPGRIGVTAPRIDFGEQASSATFSVIATKGNLTWSTSSPHPALSVSPARGSLTAGKGSIVTVRLTRPIGTGGEVPLRVTTPDGQQSTVMVRWLPSPGMLRTSTGAVHIGSSEFQERFTVDVTGGANTWTATVSAPGCTTPRCRLYLDRTSGSGSGEIIVRLEPHPSRDDPGAYSTGTITLTTPDGQRATVRVTWDPYEPG